MTSQPSTHRGSYSRSTVSLSVCDPIDRHSTPDQRPACRGADPNLFFTESMKMTRAALALCNGDPNSPNPTPCPVRSNCLEVNLYERAGVWGGTVESQRRGIRARIRDGKIPASPIAHPELPATSLYIRPPIRERKPSKVSERTPIYAKH